MKFYTIFTRAFGSPVAVFKDLKSGHYYCGGPRLKELIFTDRKAANVELAQLRRVEEKGFGKTCFVSYGVIKPLYDK